MARLEFLDDKYWLGQRINRTVMNPNEGKDERSLLATPKLIYSCTEYFDETFGLFRSIKTSNNIELK